MKKISFVIAACLALVGLASCNKTAKVEEPALEKIIVSVGIATPQTRVTGVTAQSGRNDSSDEARIDRVDVFVFNNGVLDGHAAATTSEVSVQCTAGIRQIYAVVNNPDVANIVTLNDLLAVESVLAAPAGTDAPTYQMIGNVTETLRKDGSVTVTVDRLAARVVIRKITNGFENDAQAAAFKIKSVYLTNVAGSVDFGKTTDFATTYWYNRRGYEAANNPLGSFNYDEVADADGTIAKGASYETAHYFYTMPNRYDAAVGGTWSPRAVRLLVRAEVAGVLYDYPIAITGIQSNKSYEINELVITRVGNTDNGRHDPDDPDDDDEEKPIEGFEQSFTIVVNPWTVELVNGGTITI